MKQSVFNFFFPYDKQPDSMIAYNTRTNALALIDRPHYKVWRSFADYDEKKID